MRDREARKSELMSPRSVLSTKEARRVETEHLMAPASLGLHQSLSAAWDLSANPREVFIFIFQ